MADELERSLADEEILAWASFDEKTRSVSHSSLTSYGAFQQFLTANGFRFDNFSFMWMESSKAYALGDGNSTKFQRATHSKFVEGGEKAPNSKS